MIRQFISPEKSLLQGVVEHLFSASLRQTPMGAQSLAHCMIIVPTARSARHLRLAIAKRAGEKGVLAPTIVQPEQIIQPRSLPFPEASFAELLAALTRFLSTHTSDAWSPLFDKMPSSEASHWLGFAQQCVQLWKRLSTKGYTFNDVAQSPAVQTFFIEHCQEEQTRWNQLAAFETDFLSYLHTKNLCAPVERFAYAKKDPKLPDTPIDTILLPALVDPLPVIYDILEQYDAQMKIVVLLHALSTEAHRFDQWGRPLITAWTETPPALEDSLSDKNIHLYLQNDDLSNALVTQLAKSNPYTEKLGLSVLDASLFTSLELACRQKEIAIHNPSLHTLNRSSLGRLTQNLIAFIVSPECSWEILNALLHEDDILAYISTQSPEFDRTKCLQELNLYQNTFFPKTIPDRLLDEASYRHLVLAFHLLHAFRSNQEPSLATTLRTIFSKIYAVRTTAAMEKHAAKEFLGAIHALIELLTAFDAPLLKEASSFLQTEIFKILLNQGDYQLEEDALERVTSLGWLELAWSDCETLVLAGLSEGVVPDAIVGDAFLPNQLCRVLQLNTNEQRLARDTFLFSELLRARPPDTVHVLLSVTSAAGEIQKPSRLLFLCHDATLVTRIKRFFGEIPSMRPMTQRLVPAAWRLQLPEAKPMEKGAILQTSATGLDAYLGCPFTYYLSKVLRLEGKKTKVEPEVQTFGTYLHAVLDAFAKDPQMRDLTDETRIFEAVQSHFNRLTSPLRLAHTRNLTLLLESLKRRLKTFAHIQAQLRSEGWQIVTSEYRFSNSQAIPLTEDLRLQLRGSIDRIDYKEGVGYRLIDYKTWKSTDKLKDHLISASNKSTTFYQSRHYPLVQHPKKAYALKSIQLPLYRYVLEAADPKRFRGQIKSLAYFILGESESVSGLCDTIKLGSDRPINDLYPLAIELMQSAVRDIQNAIFWPPSPEQAWQWEYASLFLTEPEDSICEEWIQQQAARFARYHQKEACHD